MKAILRSMIFLGSLFLVVGCSSLHDNPIDRSMQGPTTEQMYAEETGLVNPEIVAKTRHTTSIRDLSLDLDVQSSNATMRLPNPELVMYFFPRVYDVQGLIVPAFNVHFSMYKTVQYSLPSEVVDGR